MIAVVYGQTTAPSVSPTGSPTMSPTVSPTVPPTSSPTASPTIQPSASPIPPTTPIPSASPSASPTSFPTSSPTSGLVAVGDGFCLDGSNNHFDRLWYDRVTSLSTCQYLCAQVPEALGLSHYSVINRCYCYFSDGNTQIGVDESGTYVDYNGVEPIVSSDGDVRTACYKIRFVSTFSPTNSDQPTSLPTVSPTSFPTVASTPDLGNSPGGTPTAAPATALNTGQVAGVIIGAIGLVGVLIFVMYKKVNTASRYEYI